MLTNACSIIFLHAHKMPFINVYEVIIKTIEVSKTMRRFVFKIARKRKFSEGDSNKFETKFFVVRGKALQLKNKQAKSFMKKTRKTQSCVLDSVNDD